MSRLIETIQVFPRTSVYNSDYYFMMLHKLWSRMAEHDWRTVAKSLFIFHRMAVSVDPSLHLEFVQVSQAPNRGSKIVTSLPHFLNHCL